MVMTGRKTGSTAQEKVAAKRRVTATRNAQAASDGLARDEKFDEAIFRLQTERDAAIAAGRAQGTEDGEEWAIASQVSNAVNRR